MNWIPCSERLPQTKKQKENDLKISTNVLVWNKKGNWHKAHLVEFPDGKFYWVGVSSTDPEDVTHWMPIVGPE